MMRIPRSPAAVWNIAPGGAASTGGICRIVDVTLRARAAAGTAPAHVLLDSGGMARAGMAAAFGRALARFTLACLARQVRLVHIHVATGGSVVRKGCFLVVAKLLRTPVLLHLHGADLDRFHRRLNPFARVLLARLFRAADAIVALGPDGSRHAVSVLGCDPTRVHVVPNAVPDPGPVPLRLRASPRCRLLFLGALVDRKGLAELFAALATPTLAGLDWTLDIAGNGGITPWLARARAAGIADRVRFLGWTNPALALAGADLLVLPSRDEGLPMAILEAMALGLPTVATAVGDVGHAIRHDREGLLVAPNDPVTLAAALARAIDDPSLRTRLGAAARTRFETEFTIATHLARLDAIHDRISPRRASRTAPQLLARPQTAGRLRVACYMHSLASGGVERMRVNLLRQLDAWGAETTLLLHADEGHLAPHLPARTRTEVFGTRRTLHDLLPLIRHLRRERPDLLLVSLGHNNVVAMAAKLLARSRCKLAICQHNALSAEIAADPSHRRLPLLYRWMSPLADAIVAVSEGVADDLAATARIDRARITVIHNPVVTDDFPASAAARLEDPWFTPGAPPVYVTVGRLVRQKDHATLLRAFALHRRRCDARLIVIGEGPLRASLESLAAELGVASDIRFLGHRANPLPYMREAAAFVLSSLYEGLGNVIIEALACGTPVVATDCPHGPAEILEHGRFGRLVPPADPIALACALDPALRTVFDPALLRARAASFTAEAAAHRYLALAAPSRTTSGRAA